MSNFLNEHPTISKWIFYILAGALIFGCSVAVVFTIDPLDPYQPSRPDQNESTPIVSNTNPQMDCEEYAIVVTGDNVFARLDHRFDSEPIVRIVPGTIIYTDPSAEIQFWNDHYDHWEIWYPVSVDSLELTQTIEVETIWVSNSYGLSFLPCVPR